MGLINANAFSLTDQQGRVGALRRPDAAAWRPCPGPAIAELRRRMVGLMLWAG